VGSKPSDVVCRVQTAALAEFRADWTAAARMYTMAYGELVKITPGQPYPLQRHFEILSVAELLHIKASFQCPLLLTVVTPREAEEATRHFESSVAYAWLQSIACMQCSDLSSSVDCSLLIRFVMLRSHQSSACFQIS
jgi:hypothetical protein